MEIEPINHLLERLDTGAQGRVRDHLLRTVNGYSVDLVTPFINRSEEPDEGRIRLRDELAESILPTGYDWLDDAEADQASKIGKFSIMLPWVERREDVQAYYKRYPHESLDPVTLEMARLMLRTQLSHMRNLRAATLTEAFNKVPRGTNWGSPFFTSDKSTYRQYLAIARKIEQSSYRNSDGLELYASLYWRGQAKGIGEYPKQRVVQGTSHIQNLFEQQLQIPMLLGAQRLPEFASWVSQDRVDAVVSSLLRRAEGMGVEILSVDFKTFDQRLPAEVVDAIFQTVRELFIPEYWPLIDYVEFLFKSTKLVTPDGSYSGRPGGVPSGSTLTNWMDTLGHDLMWNYISLIFKNPIVGKLFQGDDGVVLFSKPWNIVEIEEAFKHHFGMLMGSEKGGISIEQVYFLQNVHSIHYAVDGINVGIRPAMRVLNGSASDERIKSEKWTSYDYTLSWWQKFENAKWHPKFLELARFLYRHDVYSRTLSADQVLEKGGGWRQAESILNTPSFPFGKPSLSGLRNFHIVRVLDALKLDASERVAYSKAELAEGVG